jgi:energy-coupling factor transporter transmembrane protein EcfT
MIKTKEIRLTGNEFFYLLLSTYIKKRWWLLVWIWAMILILLVGSTMSYIEYLVSIFLILLQIIQILQYWFYANASDNRIYLLPRYFAIDNEQITEHMNDGTSSIIKIDRIIRVMQVRKSYLLFVARNEYIYLPFDAFESQEDLEWFENEVIRKIKKIAG